LLELVTKEIQIFDDEMKRVQAIIIK